MDKNTFTGLFLIMVIMGASFFFMKPSEADLKKEKIQAHADSVKRGQIKSPAVTAAKADTSGAKTANKPVDSAVLKSPFGAATIGTQKFVTLENKDIRVKLSTQGGKVYSVELKDYKTFNKKPLILFDGDKNRFGLNFTAGNNSINTDKLYFTPTSGDLQVAEKDSSTLTMRLNYSPTQYVDYIYSLKGTGYKVGLTVKTTGLDQVIANTSSLNVDWSASMRRQEKDIDQERRYSTVYYMNTDNDVDYLSEGKDDSKEITDKKMQWVSFQAHFFSGVLIAKEGFTRSKLSVVTNVQDTIDSKQMTAGVIIPKSSDGSYPMEFYFGPNKYNFLKTQGYHLEKQVYMGWGFLAYINRFSVLPVFNFLSQFTSNYGIIILALTLILKLVLSPLTYKSYLSMAKMRILKPEMDEIKAKVGEDNPTLLQQEYLKLYKQAGVNPLGGCLPLLIQMPIVFAFFRFFPSLFELRGQSFLWMHDLSTYDSVITFGTNIPFIGNHISLMCLLMTVSTLIYTYFNNQISGASGQMKYIGYITPIIFLGALNSYPSGLNYYYFLANMMTFLQQYIIRLMVDDKKIHAQIQDNKKKPEVKKKKSGFQARMEEMMKQQQAAAAQKKK
ncbi:membrane protein insertase YidC [Mucilaginibacter sp. L3T2-6]|uniref:membrane protein insertase YidC n=1 Tax=Mucilaginibacter sp. L3T2-6 TaxID=3062491 RepID=UPI00267746D4|nr:membrane protein insertase YidC [Mucilaginibacter sp. L3T2-6]MDO3642761.1 membrane protein insertase YidC [Mucilaginibacter sp. L3T2-6]MDV6215410.1 membrane protein insertase YidC [Mucilaginibacter sp. L3T2-6]